MDNTSNKYVTCPECGELVEAGAFMCGRCEKLIPNGLPFFAVEKPTAILRLPAEPVSHQSDEETFRSGKAVAVIIFRRILLVLCGIFLGIVAFCLAVFVHFFILFMFG